MNTIAKNLHYLYREEPGTDGPRYIIYDRHTAQKLINTRDRSEAETCWQGILVDPPRRYPQTHL